MNGPGHEIIAMDLSNPDSPPFLSYARLWESPRPARRRIRLAWLAARLVRLADRLAPAPAMEAERTPPHERIPAAEAVGQL